MDMPRLDEEGRQIADYINDGDASNDEAAKDIADTINNAQLVPAGDIDPSYIHIPYKAVAPPEHYALSQNRPNPFNPVTTMRLHLPQAGPYALTIYSVDGRLVRRYEGKAQLGVVSIVWDGRNDQGRPLSSGVHLYRAHAGTFTASRRMILLK
jgi:hypothetical protein